MEHKLSNLKHLKQITLSDEERAYLRGRLAQVVMTPSPKAQPLFMRGMQHGLSIALSSFLFVIFVGGSMAAVAAKALPGDDLYAFKLRVNEGVKAALMNSPEEKVAFAQTRVTSRVSEIKTLAQTKTLTKEKQAIAQKALDENIKDLSAQLNTLSEESPSSALSVTASLEEDLIANKEEIKDTLEEETDATAAATIEAIDSTLKKVSEQEVKILSKEIDNIADELKKTPTDAPDLEAKGEVLGDTKAAEQATNTPSVTPLSP
jgi:hypothetical protein